MQKSLTVVAESFGIDVINAESMAKQFEEFEVIASEWDSKAKAIVVTDESQKDLIKKAGEGRKFLKKVLKNVEDTRILLKNNSLRKGQAIDGISNTLKVRIKPIMEHLIKQEKYIEIKELERKTKLHDDRVAILLPLNVNPSLYDLRNLSEEDFNNIVSSAKESIRLQEEETKRIKKERIEREEQEKAERERIMAENEKLRQDAKKREDELAKEREKSVALARLDAEKTEQLRVEKEESEKIKETVKSADELVIIARKAITNISQSTRDDCEWCDIIRSITNETIKQLGGWLE